MMFNRLCAGTLAVMLLFPLVGYAQTSPALDPMAGNAATPASIQDEAIRMLRTRVESVDWNEFTFENVIDWLREQGSVNVVVNWYAMETEGVTRDSLVTLSLTEATVGEVLKEVIEQVSEERVIRFQAIKNTVRISTKTDFERKLYVRVYDATDLLFRVPDFWGAPEIDLTQAQQGGGAGSAQTGRPVFQNTGGGEQQREQGDQELMQQMEELAILLEAIIEPEHWSTNGGPGHITSFKRSLVVRASPEVHEQIAGAFAFSH